MTESTPPADVNRNLLGIAAVFLIAMIAVVILSIANSDAPASSAATGQARLRLTAQCGRTFQDGLQIGIAYGRSDTMALAGLLARNQAFTLPAGTPVQILTTDNGIAAIQIDSGFHAGERCYLPAKWLGSD